jgi:hypothetical protein
MGLDMYLTGDRYFMGPRTRGQLKAERYDLGYWRKHPNLHGFIVQTFADGEDDCRPIDLDAAHIKHIIHAITHRQLPETTGFFFGESEDTDEQIAHDVAIFEEALKWLSIEEPGVWRTVMYQASW